MKPSSSSTSEMLPIFEIRADLEGTFIKRPNRFLGLVKVGHKIVEAHVHDPGRLPDVLIPGNRVLLKRANAKNRKTKYSLLAGKVKGNWIFTNSGYHRRLSGALLERLGEKIFPGLLKYEAEPRFDNGRLDYLLHFKDEDKLFVEIKSCTWAKEEVALFPDAPTTRGQKHLKHLIALREKGVRACLWILVFRPEAKCFRPAHEIDSKFAKLFKEALAAGVELYIHQLAYNGEKIFFKGSLPLCAFTP